MKNERRETQRISVALDAMLNSGSRRFLRCRTRNVSLEGVFLETSEKISDTKGLVELAIRLPGAVGDKTHHFGARVVHATRNGTGFTFDRLDTDAYAALLDLVFSRQPAGTW